MNFVPWFVVVVIVVVWRRRYWGLNSGKFDPKILIRFFFIGASQFYIMGGFVVTY